jgi:uncharacterized membrane protein YphA (DoxX/SURF4 family)
LRRDAALIQRLQHPNLHGTKARSSGEDKRGAIRGRAHIGLASTARQFLRRHAHGSQPDRAAERRKKLPSSDTKTASTHSYRIAKGDTMSAISAVPHASHEASPLRRILGRLRGDPAYQSFTLLRIGFTVLPIIIGADKFANVLVNWERYLAPWMAHLSPLSKLHTMHIVGVIEIVAGIAVAIKPRYGAYLVAAWLAGIVVNLLSYSGYYDVALRDFARLASKFDPPGLGFLRRD